MTKKQTEAAQPQCAPPYGQIAVIIVNYNGAHYLTRCLKAIYAANQLPAKVIVVDNASTDGSAENIEKQFPEVVLLRQTENLGFAAGNNIGVAQAQECDWLALINPDAFVEPGWLEPLAAYLGAGSTTDFLSCQLLSDDHPGQIDGAGDCYHVSGLIWRRLHGAQATPQITAQSVHPFFAPCAAAALYRRQAFMAVGGFDEQYFCYSEDVDLGFRLRLAGYQGRHVAQSRVRHVGSGITIKESDFSIYYGHRNLVWTYFKNMPTKMLWLNLPQHLVMNLVSMAYYLAKGRTVILKAKWDAIKGLSSILKKRRQIENAESAVKPYMAKGWLTPYTGRSS